MKDRLTHWPSTVPALAVLGFLAFIVTRRPDLLDKPEALLSLAGGLFLLFLKGRSNE
jgi:hypothetical protein